MSSMIMQGLLGRVGTRAKTNVLNKPSKRQTFNIDHRPFWRWNSSYSTSSIGGLVAGNSELPAGLVRESLPKHVATIMDGNRRWCKARGVPLSYVPFLDCCSAHAEVCAKLGIPFVSSLVFLPENWKRPKEYHNNILDTFQIYMETNLELFLRKQYRVSVIGELSQVSKPLQEVIKQVEEATINNTRVDLIYGVNYGGKQDVIQATRKICEKVKAGLIEPNDIDDTLFDKHLWTNINGRVTPDPDLVIRTGGPIRMSNYYLWKMSYCELYFSDVIAPDFGEEEFIKALVSYQSRQRKLGL